MEASPPVGRRVLVGCADPALAAMVRTVAAAAGLVTVTLPPGDTGTTGPSDVLVVDEGFAATAAGRSPAGGGVLVARSPSGATWRVAARWRAGVVALPDGEEVLLDRLLDGRRDTGIPAAGLTVAVTGAVGGCGTSTLAARVARVLVARGRAVTLVDTDRYGGGMDLLLGAERTPGSRWPDVLDRGAAALLELPSAAGIRLLSFDRRESAAPGDATVAELVATLRADGDVVVDAGRSRPGGGYDRMLLTAPLRVRAAAAATGVPFCERAVSGVVASGQPPQEISARDLADAVGLPLVLTVPWRRGSAPPAGRHDRSLHRLVSGWFDVDQSDAA